MNHELAKELKDAGFSQAGHGIGSQYGRHIGHPRLGIPYQYAITTQMVDKANLDKTEDYQYHPTLEELIEACGDRFGMLEYTPEVSMNHWWAHERLGGVHMTGDGSTPSEAVSKLWLALNKK